MRESDKKVIGKKSTRKRSEYLDLKISLLSMLVLKYIHFQRSYFFKKFSTVYFKQLNFSAAQKLILKIYDLFTFNVIVPMHSFIPL